MYVLFKQARKSDQKRGYIESIWKYIEKWVYRTLKVACSLGYRNISKVIKDRNVYFRFN